MPTAAKWDQSMVKCKRIILDGHWPVDICPSHVFLIPGNFSTQQRDKWQDARKSASVVVVSSITKVQCSMYAVYQSIQSRNEKQMSEQESYCSFWIDWKVLFVEL